MSWSIVLKNKDLQFCEGKSGGKIHIMKGGKPLCNCKMKEAKIIGSYSSYRSDKCHVCFERIDGGDMTDLYSDHSDFPIDEFSKNASRSELESVLRRLHSMLARERGLTKKKEEELKQKYDRICELTKSISDLEEKHESDLEKKDEEWTNKINALKARMFDKMEKAEEPVDSADSVACMIHPDAVARGTCIYAKRCAMALDFLTPISVRSCKFRVAAKEEL